MRSKLVMTIVLVCTLVSVRIVDAESAPPAAADSVYVNGDIYVGKARNPWVSAVAISDGRFVYVGDDAAAFIGPDTKVHDLDGRMVTPGLIDGHTHIGFVALMNSLIEMEPASTRAELMQSVQRLIQDNPDKEVIVSGYWSNELFGKEGPHKKDLDKFESERPVIIWDNMTHSLWANSKALQTAGVNDATVDPVPGFSFYQRDEEGEPTGWITESATSEFVNNFIEVTPAAVESMLEYMNYLRSVGVTTLLDAGSFGLDREVFAAISDLDKEGRLPVRYHGAYTLFLPGDAPTAVTTLKELGEQFNSENVRIDTLKIFYDGVVDTRTAAMSEDYFDTPGNSGEVLLSREEVLNIILQLESAGLNLHVHSVGDRATTTLLDAIQDAHDVLQRPPSIRITISHLEFVKDIDFRRFKKLGVIANFTPHWAIGYDLSHYQAGIGDLAFEMQRGQPLLSDGARVSFSSDNTTEYEWKGERESSSPFVGMQVGHTRQDVGLGPDAPMLPPLSERIQLDDLLNGYTTDAAWQLGRSDIGLIAVGKRADLVILDRHLFETNSYDIHRTKPVVVVMDGEIVVGKF